MPTDTWFTSGPHLCATGPGLSSSQGHAVLVSAADEIGRRVSLQLQPLWRVWAVVGPVRFHRDSRGLSVSAKMSAWILIRIELNLQVNLGAYSHLDLCVFPFI